jgi:hypothetical protein
MARARRVCVGEVTTTSRRIPCVHAQRAIVRASLAVDCARRRSVTIARGGTPRPMSALRVSASLSGSSTPDARNVVAPGGNISRVTTTCGAIPWR